MKKILLVTRPIAPPWDEASKNFAYYLAKNIPDLEIHLMTKGILPELGKNIIQHPIHTASQNDMDFSQKLKSLFFQWKNKDAFDATHYFFTPTKLNSFLIKNFLHSKKTKAIQTVATLREDLYSDEKIKELMFGDLIITYSDYAKNKLNALGFENVRKVSPGIDLDKYQPREKNQKLLDLHGLKKDHFIINFTGEYTRLGAIDNVIDAFIAIAPQIPSARLSLAVRVKNERDATKKEAVRKKLAQEKLLDKVAFHDEDDFKEFNMSDIYNLCDISLFPVQNMHGKFDIPLVVPESMACEKPVILSDLPILSELRTAENSVTIKNGDVKSIVNAVLDLHDHPEKRLSIGKAARKFVEERFDIRKIAEEYREIYKNLK